MRWLIAAGLALALALLAPAIQQAALVAQSPIARFEKGQTESLGGRTYRTTLHARPVNYLKGGTWQPITSQLGSTGDPGMSVGVDELIQFRIADKLAGQSPVLHIGHGQAHIRMALQGANTNVQGVVNGNSIRFDEAWNGADLEYVVGGHFVKENIYLKAGHPASFAFRIDSHQSFNALTLTFGELRILPPVLTKPGEAPVRLSWVTSVVGSKTVLTATLPAGDWSGWVLDPTTTLQPGAAGLDTVIKEKNATSNYGSNTRIGVGASGSSPNNDQRTLIEFDVSSIPSTDVVSDATLTLVDIEVTQTTSHTGEMRRVLVDWIEAEATWNIRVTGTNWTTAGCSSNGSDRSATVTDSITLDTTVNTAVFNSAQLTDDVQKWVDGTNSNFGWLITDINLTGVEFNEWKSSDDATAGDRPKLVVVHSVPPAATRAFGVIIYSASGGIPAGFPLGGLW